MIDLPRKRGHGSELALAVGAIGVVFGDIGTNPIFTLSVCTGGARRVQPDDLFGVLSLIFWALTLVVSLKYITFVMRADNDGEGGILALLALVPGWEGPAGKTRIGWITVVVLAGTALLYGDGIITPAISVLSAVEGLKGPLPRLEHAVVPITCAILLGLFAIQRRGTGAIGRLFGPVMVVWFAVIGGLGAWRLAQYPVVLRALSPWWAVTYFEHHGLAGIAVLGGVVLAVTGGEALYADMGHFGARPIRAAWWSVVLPALVLTYLGQGALLLRDPGAARSPFFALAPEGGRLPLVVLSTLAAIIASQALISGAYSLTYQAVQLGLFPRVAVRHTSRDTEGQIYLPGVNWALASGCIALVLGFQASNRLASAYGIAVSATMVLTSIVYFVVTRRTWHWSLAKAIPLLALFLATDIPLFAANGLKIFGGGFVPVGVGLVLFVIMFDWRTGRLLLRERIAETAEPIPAFLAQLESTIAARVPGTAVFLASSAQGMPGIVPHYVRRVNALHERVILLTLQMEHVPSVRDEERVTCEDLGKGFHRMIGRYGFMNSPNVPRMLALAKAKFDLPVDLQKVTYFIGHMSFLATNRGKMAALPERLFAFLSRNAQSATAQLSLPTEQVLELGTQLDL